MGNLSKFKLEDILKVYKNISKVMKVLWEVHRTYFVVVIALSIATGAAPALSIIAMQRLINTIQKIDTNNENSVIYAIMVYVSLNIAILIINTIKNHVTSLYQMQVTYALNVRVMNKTKNLTLSDFENEEIYNMLRRVQNESISRPFAVFKTITYLASQLIGLISTGTIIYLWEPWIILLIMVLPIFSTLYTAKVGYTRYNIEMMRTDKRRKAFYMNYLMTNDIAYKEIKVYQLSDYFINAFKKLHQFILRQDKDILGKQIKVSAILEIIDEGISAWVIYKIVMSAVAGRILIGDTVAYINSLSTIQNNLVGILNSVASIYQENLYIEQLFIFLDYQPDDTTETTGKIKIDSINTIEIKDLSYQYSTRTEKSLKNINLKIGKGELISFVGENGSGKTTLIKIIAGFYTDYEGDVLINGIHLREIDLDVFRTKLGVIFQDFNRYELSLRENIGFGKLSLMKDDKELLKSIEKVNAQSIFNNLNNDMDRRLGHWFGGTQLSGGQWQKIALARALIKDADMYILDEPTSSLDPLSEHEIFEIATNLCKEKIGILISHRLSNLKRTNTRIIVFKDGEIMGDGKHSDLMTNSSVYNNLYGAQETEIGFNVSG